MSSKATPNSQVLDAVLDVEKNLSEKKIWNTTELMVPFATTFGDDELKLINIMDHIGFNVRNRFKKGNRYKPQERHWLPKKFNSADPKMREEVRKHFSVVAVANGFALRVKSYERKTQRLRLFCPRGRYYVASTTTDIGRVPTTTKPIKGQCQTCPFAFSVWWDEEWKRWYIPDRQGGNSHHVGHIRVSPDFATSRLSKEDQK